MLVRIQNLYLLILVLINSLYMFANEFKFILFPIFTAFKFINVYFVFSITLISSLVSLIIFKKRKIQLLINNINILFNLFFLFLTIYEAYSFNSVYFVFIANLFFLYKANRAVKKDEELINSIDRIR